MIEQLLKTHFSGSAKFAATGRIRKFDVFAKNIDECKEQLIGSGFVEPFEIIVVPPELASDAQLSYARDLGLNFPSEIAKSDMSFLLRKTLEHEGEPNPQLLQYANNRSLLPSIYIGKRSLYDIIFKSLEGRDKVAFFIFCVYRYCTDDRYGDIDTHPQSGAFYSMADSLLVDNGFLTSMNKYEGNSLRYFGTFNVKEPDGSVVSRYGGSTQTIAYKRAVEVLQTSFTLPLRTSKTVPGKDLGKASGKQATTTGKNKWVELALGVYRGLFGK